MSLYEYGRTIEAYVFNSETVIEIYNFKLSYDYDFFRVGITTMEFDSKMEVPSPFELKLTVNAQDILLGEFIATERQFDFETKRYVYKAMRKTEDALFETYTVDESVVFPITISSFIQHTLTRLGLLNDVVVVNDFELTEDVYQFEQNTYRDVMNDLLMAIGGYMYTIDKTVYVRNEAPTAIHTLEEPRITKAKFGNKMLSPNIINVALEPQHDNVFAPSNWEEIANKVEYVFPNNQTMLSNREVHAQRLLDQLSTWYNYDIVEIETWGLFGVLPYTKIEVLDSFENVVATTFLTKSTMTFKGGISQTVETEQNLFYKDKYVLPTDRKRMETKTALTVNKIDGEIQGIVQTTQETEQTINELQTSLTQTNNAIIQAVLEREEAIDGVYRELEATAQLTKDEFTIMFNEAISGVNSVDGKIEDISSYFTFSDTGFEIGKSTSKFKIRLTNDKLSFLEGGTEIAWMTGQTLHINSATILTSIQLGNHRFEKSTFTSGRTIIRKV